MGEFLRHCRVVGRRADWTAMLLFIGIHNAWDTITFHVFIRRRQQEEGEDPGKVKK